MRRRQSGPRSEQPCPIDLHEEAATATCGQATRRARGEPRRLLLDAARTLFARQDYRSTTTREIAEAAGVTEYLLFRNFGSKAGLFREALVLPFTSFVDGFGQTWHSVVPEETDEEELSRHFVGQLYDVFVENRGLLLTLLASDGLSDDEIDDAGIADIRRALTVLGQISAEGMNMRGMRAESSRPARALDGGDDRRHGRAALDVLRKRPAHARSDHRRTRPGDPARLPASGRLAPSSTKIVG